MPITQDNLAQKIADLIQSQKPIHTGSSTQSKAQGQTIAVRLNQRIAGLPSVVRAIALTPITPGRDNISLIKLSEPINNSDWAAFSSSVTQLRSSQSETVVSQIPQPISSKKQVEITIKIGYTGRYSK